jgi:hypothetical protein
LERECGQARHSGDVAIGHRLQAQPDRRPPQGCKRRTSCPRHRRFLARVRALSQGRTPHDEDSEALWVALRKGRGKPLTYAAFESSLRYIGGKAGVPVHPHLFRHTLAQGVLDLTGNLKVAQEILGHAHISTTADIYTRVDPVSLVTGTGSGEVQLQRRAPSIVERSHRRAAIRLCLRRGHHCGARRRRKQPSAHKETTPMKPVNLADATLRQSCIALTIRRSHCVSSLEP